MVVTTIAKRFAFSASHHLESLPEDHQCRRLHGHNYRVEIVLTGTLDAHGMILDYGELGLFKQIIDQLDHRDLNHLLPAIEPTAENLAAFLFEKADHIWPNRQAPSVRVVAIRVSETENTWAEVRQLDLGLGD